MMSEIGPSMDPRFLELIVMTMSLEKGVEHTPEIARSVKQHVSTTAGLREDDVDDKAYIETVLGKAGDPSMVETLVCMFAALRGAASSSYFEPGFSKSAMRTHLGHFERFVQAKGGDPRAIRDGMGTMTSKCRATVHDPRRQFATLGLVHGERVGILQQFDGGTYKVSRVRFLADNLRPPTHTLPRHALCNFEYECANCGEVKTGMKTCSQCKHDRYCCRKCQKEDWPRHKKQHHSGSVEGPDRGAQAVEEPNKA